MKEIVKQGAVLKEEVPEVAINDENTVPVDAMSLKDIEVVRRTMNFLLTFFRLCDTIIREKYNERRFYGQIQYFGAFWAF